MARGNDGNLLQHAIELGLLEAKSHPSNWHCAILPSADETLLWHVRDRVLPLFGGRGRDHDDFPTTFNTFEHAR